MITNISGHIVYTHFYTILMHNMQVMMSYQDGRQKSINRDLALVLMASHR